MIMTDFKKSRRPLSFFKWLSMIIIFFTLSLSLWAVVLNKEIEANHDYIIIPLSNYYGVYHLDGEINNISVEFILDTGASESIISKKLLVQIQEKSNTNIRYLEKGYYILADGSEVYCDRISIKFMKIGNHTIHNVVFGIMPNETESLLGKNVLDKYKRWSVNKNLNELTLVK